MLLFQLYYNKNIVVFLYSNKSNSRFTSHSSYSEVALKPKTRKGETLLRTKDFSNPHRVAIQLGHKERPKKDKTPLAKSSFSTTISESGKHIQKKSNLS